MEMVWHVITAWHDVTAVGHIDKEFAPCDGRALNEFGFDADSCEALFHTAGW